MPSVLPFDVLNEFKNGVLARFADGNISDMPRKKEEEEDIIDEMLDIYLLAYAQATEVTNDSLSSSWQPTLGDVMKVVDE